MVSVATSEVCRGECPSTRLGQFTNGERAVHQHRFNMKLGGNPLLIWKFWSREKSVHCDGNGTTTLGLPVGSLVIIATELSWLLANKKRFNKFFTKIK